MDSLSIEVGKGEIYGFLGLNGAGKTTTIRMLLGLIRPSGGTAEIFGEKISSKTLKLWSRIGYLVETPSNYPELTVWENLESVRLLRQIKNSQSVDKILDQLDLARYANQKANTLSQGNNQRLGLAKALIHEPELLILDEPANGLDPAGVVEIRKLLLDLAKEGTTIFMSSHILGEVSRLATKIGIIHEGKLIRELDKRELEKDFRKKLLVKTPDQNLARRTLEADGYKVSINSQSELEIIDTEAITHPEIISKLLVLADAPPTLLIVGQEDLEHYFLTLVRNPDKEKK